MAGISAPVPGISSRPSFGASKPHPDHLQGRRNLAGTQATEIANTRSLAEIDALKKDLALKEGGQSHSQSHLDRTFALDEEMRRRSAANTDQMRDLLLKQFGSAPPPPGAIGLPGGEHTVPGPPPGAPGTPAVADQAFARAKDRAGLSLQSGLKTLKGVMQRRGQSGSSIEGDATADLIGGELTRMGDVDLASAAEGQRRGYQLEDRAHEDVWRGREMTDRNRMNGLQLLMSLMNGGRAY